MDNLYKEFETIWGNYVTLPETNSLNKLKISIVNIVN